jgi:hypothetical protein
MSEMLDIAKNNLNSAQNFDWHTPTNKFVELLLEDVKARRLL